MTVNQAEDKGLFFTGESVLYLKNQKRDALVKKARDIRRTGKKAYIINDGPFSHLYTN